MVKVTLSSPFLSSLVNVLGGNKFKVERKFFFLFLESMVHIDYFDAAQLPLPTCKSIVQLSVNNMLIDPENSSLVRSVSFVRMCPIKCLLV